MALIYCRECGQQISQQANACPKCGSPQKKNNYLIFILFIVLVLGGCLIYFYWPRQDDRAEKLAAAKEILSNNREDLITLTTHNVKKNWIKVGADLIITNRCDCIIDSLAPKLADKYSLDKLNQLKTRAASNLIELTKLISENSEICKQCLLFQ